MFGNKPDITLESVKTALSLFDRLQGSDFLEEHERPALRELSEWLSAHLVPALSSGQLPRDGSGGNSERGKQQQQRLLDDLSNPLVEEVMSKVSSWDDFDVFALNDASRGHPLVAVSLAAIERLGLWESLQLPTDKTSAYLAAVESKYRRDNAYHSATHAADVVQTVLSVLLTDGLAQFFTPLEVLACLLAAVVHDVDHRGVNNEFLIRTRDDLALTYNDLSVNESHHIATAFRLMQQPGCDLLSHMTDDEFTTLRGLVVDIVKSTDMQEHNKLAATLREDLSTLGPDLAVWGPVERGHALAAMLHFADISNAAKPEWLSVKWARRVTEEFWRQGDRERALSMPVQPAFDRFRADVPAAQIAFMDFVRPSFDLMAALAPSSASAALRNFEANRARWVALQRHGEKEFGDVGGGGSSSGSSSRGRAGSGPGGR